VAYVVLLAKAKAAGLAALDRQGMLKRLEGCSDEKQAVQQVQVRNRGELFCFTSLCCICCNQQAVGTR
jgi:hypothetical protein